MSERHPDHRAADTDREVVAERLRLAVDEGRLTLGEYDERLHRAYSARTYGELDGLLSDLPAPATAERSALARRDNGDTQVVREEGSGGHLSGWLVGIWGTWLTAVLVNVAIWAAASIAAGRMIYFWPIWVAGPWGAVLLAATVSGLSRGDHRRTRRPRTGSRNTGRDRWRKHDARRRVRWEQRRRA